MRCLQQLQDIAALVERSKGPWIFMERDEIEIKTSEFWAILTFDMFELNSTFQISFCPPRRYIWMCRYDNFVAQELSQLSSPNFHHCHHHPHHHIADFPLVLKNSCPNWKREIIQLYEWRDTPILRLALLAIVIMCLYCHHHHQKYNIIIIWWSSKTLLSSSSPSLPQLTILLFK